MHKLREETTYTLFLPALPFTIVTPLSLVSFSFAIWRRACWLLVSGRTAKLAGIRENVVTHYSKIICAFRLVSAPSTAVLASFNNKLVHSFLWPRRMLMIVITARHLRHQSTKRL